MIWYLLTGLGGMVLGAAAVVSFLIWGFDDVSPFR